VEGGAEDRPKRLKGEWVEFLKGKRKKPVGDWQIAIVLANRHNWTPEQVCALPASFVDELLTFYEAEAAYGEWKRKQDEKQQQAKAARSRR
jgi:hypothetical protein